MPSPFRLGLKFQRGCNPLHNVTLHCLTLYVWLPEGTDWLDVVQMIVNAFVKCPTAKWEINGSKPAEAELWDRGTLIQFRIIIVRWLRLEKHCTDKCLILSIQRVMPAAALVVAESSAEKCCWPTFSFNRCHNVDCTRRLYSYNLKET